MSTALNVPADFVDVELHGEGVGKGQRQPGALSLCRTDGAEQIGVLVALIRRLSRSGSTSCPKPDSPVLLANACLVLEPDLDRLALGKMPDMGTQRPREVFFKRRNRRGVLAGMQRAGAHVGEAELLEKRADMALVILDAEPLLDDALKIYSAPANDAVLLRVRTGLNDLGKFGLLLVRQPR